MGKQEEITQKTFEVDYRKAGGMSLDFYNQWFTTLPCHCDYEGCRGWAAIRHGGEEDHKELFGN